ESLLWRREEKASRFQFLEDRLEESQLAGLDEGPALNRRFVAQFLQLDAGHEPLRASLVCSTKQIGDLLGGGLKRLALAHPLAHRGPELAVRLGRELLELLSR